MFVDLHNLVNPCGPADLPAACLPVDRVGRELNSEDKGVKACLTTLPGLQ